MEDRSAAFLEVMIAVAVIGILAFLVGLLARSARRPQTAGVGQNEPSAPQWYEVAPALVLVAAIAALAIWLSADGGHWAWGEALGDWRSDTRTVAFAAVMVAAGVIGLIAAFAYTVAQPSLHRGKAPAETRSSAGQAAIVETAAPSPSPLRILGLLALALALLLLCWIALSSGERYALIVQLVYPASLGLALVLLFDKATRVWGVKRRAEIFREWLLCDLLVFLLCLGFLNLRGLAKPEGYAGTFWDVLNIALFFLSLWVVDRTASRVRFLVGYGYLVILPLLLLIWGAVQGTSAPASWWASIWPVFILSVVFFVLEVVALVSATSERQILPALKDALFVLLYAVLLILAVNAGAHA